VYLGSADWMQRNLYERVEVIFRLKDPALCKRVCSDILLPYFADTENAKNNRSLNGGSHSGIMAKLRASPVYEILAANWKRAPATQDNQTDQADAAPTPADLESSDAH
jgi:polyphosphate kinase